MKYTKQIYDYFVIFLGCFLVACALQYFYLPFNMVTGGFSGLAIIIARYAESLFGITLSMSTLNLALNIPIFICTLYFLGFRMLIRSFYAILSLSFSLYIWSFVPPIDVDIFIASIFGGVVCGFGHGLVLSKFCTTGGTDLIAMIINKYIKHFNVSKLLFVIDGSIIVLGFFVFGIEAAMYAIVSVFVAVKMMDVVIEGPGFSKVAYIITDKYDELSAKIMEELNRGVTGLESKGMYTKKHRVTLMVVVPTKELPRLKEITHSVDENAFMILSEAREVLGEGFKMLGEVK